MSHVPNKSHIPFSPFANSSGISCGNYYRGNRRQSSSNKKPITSLRGSLQVITMNCTAVGHIKICGNSFKIKAQFLTWFEIVLRFRNTSSFSLWNTLQLLADSLHGLFHVSHSHSKATLSVVGHASKFFKVQSTLPGLEVCCNNYWSM